MFVSSSIKDSFAIPTNLSGDIKDLFKVVGVVGIGAEMGVDGGLFKAFGFFLDIFAIEAVETAEIALELAADILQVC